MRDAIRIGLVGATLCTLPIAALFVMERRTEPAVVPLDLGVTTTKSSVFTVHFPATYYLALEFDSPMPGSCPPDAAAAGSDPDFCLVPVELAWRLRRSGFEDDAGEFAVTKGRFAVEPETARVDVARVWLEEGVDYVLEVESRADASRLNDRQPRMSLKATHFAAEEYLKWWSLSAWAGIVVLTIGGGGLLIVLVSRLSA